MGLLRIATGRDAADAAFATVFGAVASASPVIAIEALVDEDSGIVLPRHRDEILSTYDSAIPA